MENRFIEQVTAQIQSKAARRQIEQELESHILDKIDYYVEIGYSYVEAERRATEEMGSPEDTAVPLNALHSNGRGFLTLFGGFFVILLFFFSYRMNGEFSYSSYTANAVHYIKYDFISLGVFLSYVILLITARKKHNKTIPLMIIVSFAIQFFISLVCFSLKNDFLIFIDVCAVFQPMSYAILTLVSKGFGGYVDSIFAYEILDNTLFNEYAFRIMSFVFVLLLVVWSALVYVSVKRMENMSAKRGLNRTINIAEKAVSAFLAANLFVMCLGTAVALSGLSQKYDEIVGRKEQMINYIVNADLSKGYIDLLFDMQDAGFDMSIDVEYDKVSHDPMYDRYKFEENLNGIYLYTSDEDNIKNVESISYSLYEDDTIFSKNLLCSADDMKTLQNVKIGTTIDDVLKTGIIQKASEIEKSGGENLIVYFTFDEKLIEEMNEASDDLYYPIYARLGIYNGKVMDNTLIDDISTLRHTKNNMIKFIVSESRMKWDDRTGRSADAVLRLAKSNELEMSLSPLSDKMNKEFYYLAPDRFNEMLMFVDEDNKNYSLEYYNIPQYGFISMRSDEIFDGVDISEFDAITDDMTLYEYETLYDWGMTCAGIVRSSSEYDENTQRYVYTLQFIYPLKDGDNINQYIVEFYDEKLTKHYKNEESFFSLGYPAVY